MKLKIPKVPVVTFPTSCDEIVESYESNFGNVYVYEFEVDIDLHSSILNNINKVTLVASTIPDTTMRKTDIELAVRKKKKSLSTNITFGSA